MEPNDIGDFGVSGIQVSLTAIQRPAIRITPLTTDASMVHANITRWEQPLPNSANDC